MDYVIAIFFLGLMVTFVVAKGIMMANDYATSEWESHDEPVEKANSSIRSNQRKS